MVLKKPYAFLIKNFRIIHLILSGIILFIIITFAPISKFFSEYVKVTMRPGMGMGGQSISGLLYLAILVVIVFAAAMLWLMLKKKKPTLFYILTLANYLVLLIFVLIAASVMRSLDSGAITQQVARTYRDLFFIMGFPQYYFLVASFIRGMGFDIKKFNFNKDLAELEIKSEDSEEFEFVLGKNIYVYERKARRILREAKYYILENKLIFGSLCAILGVVLIFYLVTNATLVNKVYKAGKNVSLNGINYRVNSAYITAYDYNGHLVKKNKKYVVVNITVTNITPKPATIPNTSLFLMYGDTSVYNQPSLRNYFIDIGKAYVNEPLSFNASRDLIFVFEVDSNVSYKNYTLKILKEVTYDEFRQAIYHYTDFKITPKIMVQPPVRVERKTNEIFYLGQTIYKESNLIINKIELINNYQYQYESCDKKGKCKTYYDVVSPSDSINNRLLVINYKLSMNQDIGLMATMKSESFFFEKYLKIEYKYKDNVVTRDLVVKSYPGLKDKIFVDIPRIAASNDVFNVLIKTREYHYFIDCKGL